MIRPGERFGREPIEQKRLKSIKQIIESIPKNEELSIYHHGDTWHDLCRGPHLASSSKIGKAFSTKVSEPIGGVTLIMKCCKEFMALVGAPRKN